SRFAGQKSGWIFPSKKSSSGHLSTVAKQFRQARTSAGIPDSIVLYSARHTYGTEALEQTGNMPAVLRSMGHSDPRSMIRYQHPGIDALRIAVNRRNALRVGKEETYSR
ncbi:MAG TPA: tyrosine-type recombinase/integrase, partial [Terriglobales bacterium]